MKEFGLLTADQIEVRLANGKNLLLYKTSRTDADLLDSVVGADNWQNDFKRIGDVLYCGIGIKRGEEWVWKWDAGTESNYEKEKGEASDAFKRAGFKWGIGRELYSAPKISVNCDIKNWDVLAVSKIEYENERISFVEITCNGNVIFPKPERKQAEAPKPLVDETMMRCSCCGSVIQPYMYNGKERSIREHAEQSKKEFGDIYCVSCIVHKKYADK